MGRGRYWVFRWVALVAAGSLAVHELRYAIEYGAQTGHVLAYQGHSYLPFTESLVAVLWLSACLRFALSLVRAGREGVTEASSPRFARLWAGSAATLISIYTLQETIEGSLSPGHPGGTIGVYGNGGWTAVLLSLAIGALIALLLRGSQAVLIALAGRRVAACRPRAARGRWATTFEVLPRRLDVIAANLAGRAPPPSL